MSNEKKLYCVCGKSYSSAPSLCVHRKKCNMFLEDKSKNKNIFVTEHFNQGIYVKETYTSRIIDLENIIKCKDEEIQVLKNEIQTLKNPTQEIQNVVLQIEPVPQVENFNIKKSKIKVKSLSSVERADNLLYIHTNSNLNTNKVCNAKIEIPPFSKSALNFIQFLDDINIELTHFENIANKGCVSSFIGVIEEQLQMIDPEERPFNYDKPNKILYIKNKDNEWIIDKENGLLRTFILKLSKKYMDLLDEYKAKYENVDNSQHPQNSNFSNILIELNSLSDDDTETLKKIMKLLRKSIHL